MNLSDALTDAVNTGRVAAADAATWETLARIRLADWWIRADLTEDYPCDDETAVQLCQSVDYLISLEELIRFIDVQAFDSGITIVNGRRVWTARNIVQLATFLECRRSWRPGSEIHASKLTLAEKSLELFRENGQEHDLFPDLVQFDLRSLLLLICESENRQQREILRVAIQLKLGTFDISC